MKIELIVSIVGALISACIGPICVYLVKRGIDKRDAKSKKAEEDRQKAEELRKKQEEELYEIKKREEEHKHEHWQNEVKDLLKPVITDVADIKKDMTEQKVELASVKALLKSNEAATILELRTDMKAIRDRYVNEGKKLDTGDIATWKELYKRYSEMGGNHFKEYVDSWGQEIGLTTDDLRQLRDEAGIETGKRRKRK